MKSILEGIRRMFTLPKKYNSLEDLQADPAGAIEYTILNLRQLRDVLYLTGQTDAEDRVNEAIVALKKAKAIVESVKK